MRLLAEEFLYGFLDLGDACRAADEDYLIDIAGLQFGVLQCLSTRGLGARDEIGGKALELGARQAGL